MCAYSKLTVSRIRVPAGYGRSFEVSKGRVITVLDIEGGQCIDFWALDVKDFGNRSGVEAKLLSRNCSTALE